MIDNEMLWAKPPGKLDLAPDQTDIWRINLDLPFDTIKTLEATLSEEESQRAARFHFPADKDRYICAHAALRGILSQYLHCEPSELSFDTNDHGKPLLKGQELEFNLSHSGDMALIVISLERKVGIDVERIRSDIELESMAKRFFSPNEVGELMSLPPEQRTIGFFNCWTRKEAYIKGQGLGLSLPLDSFDVSLTPNEPALLHATRPQSHLAGYWTIRSLEVDSGYAAAVAVEAKKLDLRLWKWYPGWSTIIL